MSLKPREPETPDENVCSKLNRFIAAGEIGKFNDIKLATLNKNPPGKY